LALTKSTNPCCSSNPVLQSVDSRKSASISVARHNAHVTWTFQQSSQWVLSPHDHWSNGSLSLPIAFSPLLLCVCLHLFTNPHLLDYRDQVVGNIATPWAPGRWVHFPVRYWCLLIDDMPVLYPVAVHLLVMEHNAPTLRALVEVVAIALLGEGAGIYDE